MEKRLRNNSVNREFRDVIKRRVNRTAEAEEGGYYTTTIIHRKREATRGNIPRNIEGLTRDGYKRMRNFHRPQFLLN